MVQYWFGVVMLPLPSFSASSLWYEVQACKDSQGQVSECSQGTLPLFGLWPLTEHFVLHTPLQLGDPDKDFVSTKQI